MYGMTDRYSESAGGNNLTLTLTETEVMVLKAMCRRFRNARGVSVTVERIERKLET